MGFFRGAISLVFATVWSWNLPLRMVSARAQMSKRMRIRSEKANRREFQQKKKKSKETIKKGSKQRSVGEGRIRAEDT